MFREKNFIITFVDRCTRGESILQPSTGFCIMYSAFLAGRLIVTSNYSWVCTTLVTIFHLCKLSYIERSLI